MRRLLRRAEPRGAAPALRPATEIVERFERHGGHATAALALTRRQVAGLIAEVDDARRFDRLCELVRRTGDPWNADDWPLGFDPLLCCVPLCTLVRYECARCPVGRRQEGRSCAHPDSAFGRIGELVRSGDRLRLRAYLHELDAMLADLEA